MPDSPPPIGFRTEVYPPNTPPPSNFTPQYPISSGIALSYPMPMPMPMPELPSHFIPSETSDERQIATPLSSSSSSSSDSVIELQKLERLEQQQPFHFDKFGYCWQTLFAGAPFPADVAVRAGRDQDGSIIYAGRAFHEGDMVPAKVIPDKSVAYIAYGGEEIAKYDYEILRTGDFVWEFATNGEIPSGAVEVGQTVDGEKLYMGRCLYEGSQTPGKVQASHGCLYIPFNGAEVAVTEYEVLVLK